MKAHPFFEDIDWDSLLAKKISPPVMLVVDEETSVISD